MTVVRVAPMAGTAGPTGATGPTGVQGASGAPAGTAQYGYSAAKTVDTTRASTNTYTADPELSISGVATGVYQFRAVLNVVANAGYLGATIAFTGTSSGLVLATQFHQASTYNFILANGSSWTGGNTISSITNTNVGSIIEASAIVTVTVGGTLSINWAQQVATTPGAILKAGSLIVLSRIS